MGVVLGTIIVLGLILIIFIFYSVKKKKKEPSKKSSLSYEDYSSLSESEEQLNIINIVRRDNNHLIVYYNDLGENKHLDVNLALEEDRGKFDRIFLSEMNINKFRSRNEHFTSEKMMEDVRRFLSIRLKNVNDSVSYEEFFKELEIFMNQKVILIKAIEGLVK